MPISEYRFAGQNKTGLNVRGGKVVVAVPVMQSGIAVMGFGARSSLCRNSAC
jgi:hypothetical protein